MRPQPAILRPERNLPALLDRAALMLSEGRLVEARAACERALYLAPKNPDALHLHGLVLCASGDIEKGLRLIRRAVAFRPGFAAAFNNLGNILKSAGRHEEALAQYDKALTVDPAMAEALYNCANALRDLGRPASALERYDRALALKPAYAEAWANRGNALGELGRREDALESFERALALRPDFAEAAFNRGNALAALGRPEAAIASFDQALVLRPDFVDGWNNRGIALQSLTRLADAAASYQRALSHAPEDAGTLNNLGNLYHEQGRVAEALAAFEQAERAAPDRFRAGSNRLLMLNYQTALAPAEMLAAHLAWGRGLDVPTLPFGPRPPGRLRVGYVSADFHMHSVAYFFEPLLAHHDKSVVETFCYAAGPRFDATSVRLKAHADHWVPIDRLSDADAAARIRADAIDVLVDLGGHTGAARLTLFALRPATVQVTWLGYPNTTCLATMDYRLTDAIADPDGVADDHHSERLLRLDQGFLCYRPPEDAPPVAPSPCLARGYITFGSFNHPAKLSDETLAVWADLLGRVPGARLRLKAKAFSDPATHRFHLNRLIALGVSADRVELMGTIDDRAGHLAAYGDIDLALDPFPYNGTTTSCEALWMGVPLVTLVGDRHAGRVGASLLTRVGLGDLIAADPAAYVDLAARLAMDLERLVGLRAGMRARLAASPLLDGAGFARAVERLLGELNRPGLSR